MLVSRLTNTKTTITRAIRGRTWSDLFGTLFLPHGLPLLLAPVMGVPLAFFIVNEQLHLVFGLLLLVPSLVLFNTYPFAALIIWLLLNPFLQETPNRAFRLVYWMIHRALPPAALGMVVLASLLGVARKRRQVRLGPAEVAMVVYLGLTLLNIFWFQSSPVPYLYLLYDRVFVPFCLYLLIRLVLPCERDLRRLIPVAFTIVLVESVVGALSWFRPEMLPPAWLDYQGGRATGTLAYPHAYTTTLIVFAFLLFHDATNRKPGLVRSALLLTFGFGVFSIFLSGSRGSWLGALAAGTGLLLMYPKTTIWMMVIGLILMGILGSSVLSDQMAFARERMNSASTVQDRWVIWDAGLQMIGTKPLFGWGYGNYRLYAGQFQRRVLNYVAASAHASHNSYIAVAAEMGLPTLFFFVFPVLWWLMLTFKVWPRMPKEGFLSRALLLVLWMVILDHVVVNFFSDMRHSTYGMGMWWITLGLIANMVNTYLQPDDLRPPRWIQRASQTEGF